MTALFGFTRTRTNNQQDNEILDSMGKVLLHRGPDGTAMFESDRICMGSHLFRVGSASIQQPLLRADMRPDTPVAIAGTEQASALPEGCFAISFDGEIYNADELREELEEEGWQFSTSSDAEVALLGFFEWNEELLKKIEGPFAFAIWDGIEDELFCARDAFGIRPFYYTQAYAGDDGSEVSVIFASEMKGILRHPAYKKRFNIAALREFLTFQYSALDEQFFKDIYRLPAGHCMRIVEDGILSVDRWASPVFDPDESKDLDEAEHDIAKALAKDLALLLDPEHADVPVGVTLDGDFQDAALAELANKQIGHVPLFATSFERPEKEDGRPEGMISDAAYAAQENDLAPEGTYISWKEAMTAVPSIIWHLETPCADPTMLSRWFTDKAAAKHVRIALSGIGADELFGGYSAYHDAVIADEKEVTHKQAARVGVRILAQLRGKSSVADEQQIMDPEDWYFGHGSLSSLSDSQNGSILNTGDTVRVTVQGTARRSDMTADVLVRPYYDEVQHLDRPTRMQQLDMRTYLPESEIQLADRISMAHSMEMRFPFLQKNVADTALSLSTRKRVSAQGTKVALRSALGYEGDVIGGASTVVPLFEWLRTREFFEAMVDEFDTEYGGDFFMLPNVATLLKQHRANVADRSNMIWGLFTFLVWYRIFFVESYEEESLIEGVATAYERRLEGAEDAELAHVVLADDGETEARFGFFGFERKNDEEEEDPTTEDAEK